MPKVSVIVPNYNHAPFLRKRVDTVLAQTFQSFELILLDDYSSDDSRSILSSYASDPRVRLDFNEQNSGSTFKQWNKGVHLARGEYIWIAESDDYADPHLLERLVPLLDSGPRIVYAYCRSWRVSDRAKLDGYADYYLERIDSHRWTSDYVADGREECRNYFTRINPVPNASAVLFRKCVYESVGGADETLRLCGDWKLWAAMALTGEVAYLGQPLNYFRFHGASMRSITLANRTDVAEMLEVIKWALHQGRPSPEIMNQLCRLQSEYWVPALMSGHVSRSLKQNILRNVLTIDPHPVRRALRPALSTIRLKLLRHWRELTSARAPSSQL